MPSEWGAVGTGPHVLGKILLPLPGLEPRRGRSFAGINSWSFALHSLYHVTDLSNVINNKSKAVLFTDRTSIIATNSKILSASM